MRAIHTALVALALCSQGTPAAAQVFTDSGFGLNKATGGTILGAAAGAFAGAHIGKGTGRLAATGAGALLGGIVGGNIGQSLDRADSVYNQQSFRTPLTANNIGAVFSTTSTAWPAPGVYGSSAPMTPTYRTAPAASECREFTQNVMIGSHVEQAYGTACRQPDGSWRLQP
jgi:surface antigen